MFCLIIYLNILGGDLQITHSREKHIDRSDCKLRQFLVLNGPWALAVMKYVKKVNKSFFTV